MNARLTCLDFGTSPDEILLNELPLVIGRGEDCLICLDDRWVSRRHCEIVASAGYLVVRDLGSKYGTFVNGRQVREIRLSPGDMLSVGLSNFIARYEPQTATRAAQEHTLPASEQVSLPESSRGSDRAPYALHAAVDEWQPAGQQ
jgi:pSer/pThr/pTyr-binding forkhead associated (FHA) protein